MEEEIRTSRDLKQMSEMENRLAVAVEQIDQLKKQLEDTTSWSEKISKRSELISEGLLEWSLGPH